jgi:pimeloyl-ACP methyl ester carboxylesterase
MLLALSTALAHAACDGPELRVVDRPLDPANPEAGTFPYRIRIEPGADPAAPVVVFLPGGPGFAVMEQGRAQGVVPPALTLVTTELRGVGCNQVPGPPSEASAHTATHAEDVLAALSAAGIDTFTVYGHSYGTVLGTVVAHLAEQRGMTVRSVILEGPVGRSWQGDDGWFDGFAAKWDALRALPEAKPLRRRLGGLGFTPEQWGEWIYGTLGAGDDDGGPDPVLAVGAGPKRALREAIAALGTPPAPSPGEAWATEHTLCRELMEESFVHARLRPDGGLEPFEDGCAAAPLDRPYDPADWPIRAPIVYLVGDADPVTPWVRARAQHLDAQPESPRTVVTVRGAGHFTALQLGDCAAPVFTAAAEGRAPDATACARPITVEVVPGLVRPGNPGSGPTLP